VQEPWLLAYPGPVAVRIAFGCRYDPTADGWRRLPGPAPLSDLLRLDPSRGDAGRVVYRLPSEPGLYWLRWSEQSTSEGSAGRVRWRDSMVAAGPLLCNDIHLGPAPAGRIAACVPGDKEARATFVPDPSQACAP
jgi:hypothetical protein